MFNVFVFVVASAQAAGSLDLNACPARSLPLPAQLDEAKKAVLTVQSSEGVGAAVIMDPQGIALTAAHVVGTDDNVTVRTSSGIELGAEVITVDAEHDLAVIDVIGKGYPCLTPTFDRPGTGTELFAIGTPAGDELAFSVAKGVVAGYPEIDGRTFLQTDASINPGNSGGPLLTPDGHVAAVVSWKVAGGAYEGLGFGIPMEDVRDTLGAEPADGDLIGSETTSSGGRDDLAAVHFTAPGDEITIAVLASQQATTGASQYGTISFVSNQWTDLCMAPCTKQFKPGVYTYMAYGDHVEPLRTKVELKPGDERTMNARPRTRSLGVLGRMTTAFGISGLITGASIWGTGTIMATSSPKGGEVINIGKQTTIGGAVLTGAGWGLLIATKGKWK